MTLAERLTDGDLFQGYAYAYPHKTAYGPLSPPVDLQEAWADEDTTALFLYAHVPFCEMRCGFCNLFTTTHPGGGLVASYLDALARQATVVSAAIGSGATVARLALGGGTPTFLSADELVRLFDILQGRFTVSPGARLAIELSPKTTDAARLSVLRERGVHRVSLGIQSFVEAETRELGRAQHPDTVLAALRLLRAAGFPVLNVDLIYGTPGQTDESWRHSLAMALAFEPEEVYLYPLYVRPLTGLGRTGQPPADTRADLYRTGRDALRQRGYRQISMRLFRAAHCDDAAGPEYCCQEDGMVGLGAGARSYTTRLHYSSEWAVGRPGVQAIIDDYVGRDDTRFAAADYGCRLDPGEQRRRFIIKSLLRSTGLDADHYERKFGTDVEADFPCLEELPALGGAAWANGILALNDQGMEWSDVIGPWLFSSVMRKRMESFELA